MSSVIAVLTRQWKLPVFAGIFVALLSFFVGIVLPSDYKAETDLLILTRQSGTDPLTTARAQERIAETLARTVETDAVYAQVMARPDLSEDAKNDLRNSDSRKQRKQWERQVDARAIFGTNMLRVSAYGNTKEQAQDLARAVSQTMIQNGSEYVGTLIVARVVNEPIAGAWPARPNPLVNAGVGFVVGVLAMGWLVVSRGKRSIIA